VEERKTPWELWLGTAPPLPPFAIGALVTVGLLSLQAAYQLAFGYSFWDPERGHLLGPPRSALVVAVLTGYSLAAFWSTRLAVIRELGAYAAEVESPASELFPPAAPDFPVEIVRGSRVVGALGAALMLVLFGVANLFVDDWGAGTPGVVAMNVLIGWILGRVGYYTLVTASEAAGPRAPELKVDLLRLQPLARFGRIGLRLSLAWIGGISVFALLSFLFPMFGEGVGWWVVPIPVFLATLLVAMLALTIPVRGVRERIRRAKQQALAELEDGLRAARDAGVKGDLRMQGHLSDLLAYRAYVVGVREWPFDTSTLVRFALYLLIPLGSWLGGALVERALTVLLD
jgi:hypothetical protein